MSASDAAEGLGFTHTPFDRRTLDRLRLLARLPRDLVFGRLGYALKRPLFALPVYRYSLAGRAPTALTVSPADPWPGHAGTGGLILEDTFTLAGRTVQAPPRLWSPTGVDRDWLAALHSFDWLRDLRAVGGDTARRRARELAADWLTYHDRWDPLAWAPSVTARRLASWLGQYEFFAASAEIEFRHRLLGSLVRQARHLDRALPAGLAGAEALTAAKGMIYAGVSLPGGATWLRRGLSILRHNLAHQILADGGHVARSPAVQLTVLRDLIDMRAALHAGGVETPPGLQAAIEQMAPMLRLFRHGDGALALFNGASEAEGWQIDLVLQRAGSRPRALSLAPQSGFQRLHGGRTVVLVDAGRPPPPGLDAEAHAGTLSFEMSVGRERLIVNCGAHPAARGWGRAYRATAAHSTLAVAETNSSRISADGALTRRPETVTCRREEAEGHHWLEMSHDGYAAVFGMVHHRRLYLAASGEDLRGEDRLDGPAGKDFTVRFHLHPDVRAIPARDGQTVLLRLGRGGGWRFRAQGAAMALEPSIYLGRAGEARRTQQVVLTGRTKSGGATVKWALRKESKSGPKR